MNRINRRDVLLGLGAAAAAAVAPGVPAVAESGWPGAYEAGVAYFKPFERTFLTGMRVVKIDIHRLTVGWGIPEGSPVARISLANDGGASVGYTTDSEEIIAEMQRAAMVDRTFTVEIERDPAERESVVALGSEDGKDIDFGDYDTWP